MSDDAREFVSEGEYEASGRNTVGLGLALLLIGFAAGAIAAALMTPKTGKQMRRELKRKLDDAREAMDDWSDQANDWVEGIRPGKQGFRLGRRCQGESRPAGEENAPLVSGNKQPGFEAAAVMPFGNLRESLSSLAICSGK